MSSPSKGMQIALGAGIVALLLGWYAWTNLREGVAFQYYQSLDEFLAAGESLEGRPLRVHGYVANDSIERSLEAKHVRFTVQNLSIQAIDTENNLILVKGAVPGPKGAVVLIRTAAKTTLKKGGVK